MVENTNLSGDVIAISDGDLTMIDSTLRTRATVESGSSQYALLMSNGDVEIHDTVVEGFRPRTTLTNVDGTIVGSVFPTIFLGSGVNDLDIRSTTLDASGTTLTGSGLLPFGSSTGVKRVHMTDVVVVGIGSITAVSVGSDTNLLIEHSSVTEGRILGTGSAEIRFVSVDNSVGVTNQTCFAVARLDNSTFSDTTCP